MTPVEIIVGAYFAAGVLANTGLLWRIGLKVGNMEGNMSFVKTKIQEHNNLVQRVTVLEVKELFLGARSKTRGTVEPDDRAAKE